MYTKKSSYSLENNHLNRSDQLLTAETPTEILIKVFIHGKMLWKLEEEGRQFIVLFRHLGITRKNKC